MKRIALLIANSNGLEGTKADVGKMTRFLKSFHGGAWETSEILSVSDPSKVDLLNSFKIIREANLDYVIIMFSGHGGYRDETILEINPDEEKINISNMLRLAHRQLSIFDCCRVMEKQHLRDNILIKSSSSVEQFSIRNDIRQIIREKYEERILNAIPQQTTLFACSVGESSYDSKNGAVYIDNLIETATEQSDNEFMTVGQAHQKAARLTTAETSVPPITRYEDYEGPQNPEACLPKCLSSQQLVISINPNFYCDYL
jgi:hypothetical protein